MRAMEWTGLQLRLLDQRLLPAEERWIDCKTEEDIASAIVQMVVRGAPAIATAAAYGVAMAAHRLRHASPVDFRQGIESVVVRLGSTRPTAVNLRWALDRMQRVMTRAIQDTASSDTVATRLREEAEQIAAEDITTNQQIGEVGAGLFDHPVRILTHCNTGSLATVEYGTALGIIRSLHRRHLLTGLYVDETRPYLQGARLTAFELASEQIPYQLITDNTAAYLMQQGQVDAVLVGADRIAANGDTANKIGTYGLAVLCHHHQIPFYVAAPLSSFDSTLASGDEIPIESRAAEEVTHFAGHRVAPVGAQALHIAFDVTPAAYITAIVTESGVIEHPVTASITRFMESAAGTEQGRGVSE